MKVLIVGTNQEQEKPLRTLKFSVKINMKYSVMFNSIIFVEMTDCSAVVAYLKDLDTDHCLSLGGAFGLHNPKVKRMRRYPHDVVEAWLRREDNVLNKCPPTWRSLMEALEEIDQTGIADKVNRDHLCGHD